VPVGVGDAGTEAEGSGCTPCRACGSTCPSSSSTSCSSEPTDGGRLARLVPTGSVPDLAAALVTALREPAADRADRVAAARAWAAGFDLPAVAARLADLLAARAGATAAVG